VYSVSKVSGLLSVCFHHQTSNSAIVSLSRFPFLHAVYEV